MSSIKAARENQPPTQTQLTRRPLNMFAPGEKFKISKKYFILFLTAFFSTRALLTPNFHGRNSSNTDYEIVYFIHNSVGLLRFKS